MSSLISLPADLAYYVPDPTVVMMGCRPNLLPAPPRARPCPTCGGSIRPGDLGHYCAQCDRVAERNEDRLRAQRRGAECRERSELDEAKARDELPRRGVVLSESERRRLWNGYRDGILSPSARVTNRARVGRDFLASIGQEPDWSLTLDARGRVAGRDVA